MTETNITMRGTPDGRAVVVEQETELKQRAKHVEAVAAKAYQILVEYNLSLNEGLKVIDYFHEKIKSAKLS